jgi:4-diphosphocytidyl-2-C-methyl-D-erythritol kinase
LITFPNCKINLGLRILRKRSDGYHDLETIFYPIPFYDVLEFIPSPDNKLSFTTTGHTLDGPPSDNLCIRAYELLKKEYPSIAGGQLHLHKAIPSGAGLGGGSADAAFTLQLINKQSGLGLSSEQLLRLALHLGSDGPFFIINQPSFATSRGEELTPVKVDLSGYQIVLINPGIHISTARAFTGVIPAIPEKSIRSVIEQPVNTWKNELINDFESTVFKQYPAIRSIKDELYAYGAIYASMSGSGSTVYGIFEKTKKLNLSFPDTYFVRLLIGKTK